MKKNSVDEDAQKITHRNMILEFGLNAKLPHEKLVAASFQGDLLSVTELLSSRVNPNAKVKGGMTALYMAASEGHSEIVRVLIQSGANVNVVARPGGTALIAACFFGHVEVVKILLEARADVSLTDEHKFTALERASGRGHRKIVSMLLQAGARPVRPVQGHTENWPMLFALSSGRKNVVELLLEHEEGLGSDSEVTHMALAFAASEGQSEIVKVMMEHLTPVPYMGYVYWLPLLEAVRISSVDIVKILIEHGANVNAEYHGITPLHLAAVGARLRIAEMLIAQGADVNAIDDMGRTVLMWASEEDSEDSMELVKLLLEKGADSNVQFTDGTTAVFNAVRNRNQELLELFIQHGANVNLGPDTGATLLGMVAFLGDVKILETLLKAGANPEPSIGGVTALQLAIDKGHNDVIAVLKKYGAVDPREQDRAEEEAKEWDDYVTKELFEAIEAGNLVRVTDALAAGTPLTTFDLKGDTPLLTAVESGDEHMVQLLLDHGSDPNAKNSRNGETALMRAMEKKYLHLASLLLGFGANIDDTNNGGETAIMNMADKDDFEGAKFLVDQGCNINAGDSVSKQTAATRAFRHKKQELFDFLVQKGGRIDSRIMVNVAQKGTTKLVKKLLAAGCDVSDDAVLAASQAGQAHIVKMLIAHGASPNATGGPVNGTALIVDYAALIIAAREGHLGVVKELIKGGAAVNALGHNDTTALIEAAKRGNFQIVKFLVNKGANASAQDGKGRTALDYAKQTADYARFAAAEGRVAQIVEKSPAERAKMLRELKSTDIATVRQIIQLLESAE